MDKVTSWAKNTLAKARNLFYAQAESHVSYVLLDGVRTAVSWKDGHICIEGYNLENEKVALALSGNYGQGGGILLISLNESCPRGTDLREYLEFFDEETAEIKNIDWKTVSAMTLTPSTLENLSYSPDIDCRQFVASKTKFNTASWTRMLKDKNQNIIATLVRRHDLPKEYLNVFVNDPRQSVREALAFNSSLDLETRLLLAQDPNAEVRTSALEGSYNDAKVALGLVLSPDEDSSVRKAIERAVHYNDDLAYTLAMHGDEEIKLFIARTTSNPGVLLVLAQNSTDKILEEIKTNSFYAKIRKLPTSNTESQQLKELLKNKHRRAA